MVLILGAIFGQLLTTLIDKTGLTGTDRLLGILFGAARGAVLVAVLVYLAALTPMPEDPWWKESQLIGHFQTLADRLLDADPPGGRGQDQEPVNHARSRRASPVASRRGPGLWCPTHPPSQRPGANLR